MKNVDIDQRFFLPYRIVCAVRILAFLQYTNSNEMTNLERVKDLHINYVGTGKLMEGFELYYADNVVMSELGEEPRIGKDFNREYERNFLAGIKEIHGADF